MENLLIVDDDQVIRDIFTLLLREHGYAVESAAGAMECLDCLARTTPDLVLLDIMMYPVDGWETLAAIRKNPLTAGIPVIMFSGKNPSRIEISRYGEWIEDYLMKPVSVQVIKNSLKGVFDRYRASRAEREHFLHRGGDPRMIEEYLSLKRFLFIHGKFARDLHEDAEDSRLGTPSRKARFEELGRIISSRVQGEDAARNQENV